MRRPQDETYDPEYQGRTLTWELPIQGQLPLEVEERFLGDEEDVTPTFPLASAPSSSRPPPEPSAVEPSADARGSSAAVIRSRGTPRRPRFDARPVRRKVSPFALASGGLTLLLMLGVGWAVLPRASRTQAPSAPRADLTPISQEPDIDPAQLLPPPSPEAVLEPIELMGPPLPRDFVRALPERKLSRAERRRRHRERVTSSLQETVLGGRRLSTAKLVPAEEAAPDALVWPVPSNVITSRFGARKDPLEPESAALHRGIDVRCPRGTAVLAAAAGEVVVAHKSRRGGVTVRIRHDNGLSTLYAHMIKAEVQRGERVEAGQIIGRSGSTGRVTGPHLHLEVWRGRKPMDPMRLAWRENAGAPSLPTSAPAVAQPPAAPPGGVSDPRLVGALAGRHSEPVALPGAAVQTLPPLHPK